MLQAQASLMATMQRNAAIMAYNDVFLMMTVFLGFAAILMLASKEK